VAQYLGRDCDSACQLIGSIGLSDSVEAKLARFLLDSSAEGQSSHEGMRVRLALTHEEIAQLKVQVKKSPLHQVGAGF
jgi:hypothetical protein